MPQNLEMLKIHVEGILHSVRLLMASQNHDWDRAMDHLSAIEKDAIRLQAALESKMAARPRVGSNIRQRSSGEASSKWR